MTDELKRKVEELLILKSDFKDQKGRERDKSEIRMWDLYHSLTPEEKDFLYFVEGILSYVDKNKIKSVGYQ